MVTEPTRYENVLDLFLTNNSTLVNKVEIIPGFSDHDIVYTEVSIKPQILPQKPRVMSVYKKADWDALSCHMSTFQETFMEDHESKSVNKLWLDFKTALQEGIDKFVPKKTISSKPSLPWMTQEIRRNIRKRDSLFQKYKKNRTPKDREVFIQMRHQVRHKLNLAHNQYLEDILGISKTEDDAEPGKSSLSAKKLYTMLNRSKNDSRGVPSHAGMVSYILRTKTRPISSTASFSQFSLPKPHWHSAA